MKNFLLILNIILLGLVGYLYYLHFSENKKPENFAERNSFASAINHDKNCRVAYIDLDSLQNNYSYYKKVKTDFDRRQTAANNELVTLQKKYQDRAMQLQQKASTMSQAEQEAAMKEMNKMQQDLQERKQGLDNELYDYNSKMKEDILNRIQRFLKVYNKDGKYSYIFSYEPGFMFYKDSTLNITADVIVGLNQLDSSKAK